MQDVIEVKKLVKIFRRPIKEEGIKGIIKYYIKPQWGEVHALRGISFSVKKGEILGFIGPNGAGKTTTLKILSGVLYPTRGSAKVLGFTPHERRSRFLHLITFFSGQTGFLEWLAWDLTPLDGYRLLSGIYGVDWNKTLSFIGKMAEMLELKDVLNVPIRRLSLGQRIKVELAGALVHKPQILFLDEPTLGLDVVSQKRVREFIKLYVEEEGATVILTSHYMKDVDELADRIIIIDRGELVYEGTCDDIKNNLYPYVLLEVLTNNPITLLSAEIIKTNTGSVTYRVKREELERVKELLGRERGIKGFTIKEPDLETVVSDLFEKKSYETA